MYPVPLGDVNTEIPARQHVIFWADGQHTRGTFHLNFTLTPGQDNWIGVYDADGKTLIDEVVIPASLTADQSYARMEDGVTGESIETTWEIRDGSEGKYVTPSSNNIIKDTNKKIEMFAERDKNGFAMTLMAMCIVFSALLLLSESNQAKSHGADLREMPKEDRPGQDSGEVIAAIAMALHDHLDTHDRENTVLTINKVKRAYSPWSSKF